MEKKIGVRVRSTILVLLLLMGAFFVVMATDTVAAAPGATDFIDGYGTWTYTGTNIERFTPGSGVTAVVMPTSNGGSNFLTFSLSTFYDRPTIVSLTIPNCYTSIPTGTSAEDGAFHDLVALHELTIGNGVTTIGAYACYFSASTGDLTHLIFGDDPHVTTIEMYAFYYCHHLTSVTMPNSVTQILRYAFASCTSLTLTSVTISDSLHVIDYYSFSDCISLTSVTIPNNANLGSWAFSGCTAMTSVIFGSGVGDIPWGLFSGCTSLTSISFLGLEAPSWVGSKWIDHTPIGIVGHAYAASNFPAPGGYWYGLLMTVGPLDHYHVDSASPQLAGREWTGTVTAVDQYNNPNTTHDALLVTMTSSSGDAVFNATSHGSANPVYSLAHDSATFSYFVADTVAQTGLTLTATDTNGKTGTSAAITVNAKAIADYDVDSASPQLAGREWTGTVTAHDQYGNLNSTHATILVTMTSSTSHAKFNTSAGTGPLVTVYTFNTGEIGRAHV